MKKILHQKVGWTATKICGVINSNSKKNVKIMNKIILSIISLVTFCVTGIQAQNSSSSSHLTQLITVNGNDYFADNITIAENKLVANSTDNIIEIALKHGGTTNFNIQKALYCIAGTTTMDAILNASGNQTLNITGSLNQLDFNRIWESALDVDTINFINININESTDFAYRWQNFKIGTVTFRGAARGLSKLSYTFIDNKNITSVSFDEFDFGDKELSCASMFQNCSSLKSVSFANSKLKNFECPANVSEMRIIGNN